MRRHLTVAYRVCPVLASTAAGYADKFEMVSDTTASLARALEAIPCRVVVILDGCPDEYRELMERQFAGLEVEIVETPSIKNRPTFLRQMDILLNVPDDEAVYFAEDDYLYRADAFRIMLAALEREGVDFVTPLDHPDRYLRLLPEPEPTGSFDIESVRWHPVSSTCLTFLTTRRVLKEAEGFFRSYGGVTSDAGIWLALTHAGLFTFRHTVLAVLRYALGLRKSFAEFVPLEAWRRLGGRIISSRKFLLYGPEPSLCAHLCTQSLPPNAAEFVDDARKRDVQECVDAYLGDERP